MNARQIIDKRKDLWYSKGDINLDNDYREATANYMLSDKGSNLRKEIKEHPEYMIEMFYVIVDKEQQTVPFFLNDIQIEFMELLNRDKQLYQEGKVLHLKYMVLKGRQAGFTSFINAYQLACAITQKNFSGYTLADNADNTENIFSDKAKYYFDNLPDKIKPTTKYSSRKELDFSKENGKGMNSKWRVATAGNRDAGRSKTLSFFHGSEAAFWVDLKKLLTGLAEAFTKSCIVILETTANSYNEYKTMWDDPDSNYRKLFFEWWKTQEYQYEFETKSIEEQFKADVMAATEGQENADFEMWCLSKCQWLLEVKGLSWQQVYWYYHKWKDKKATIKQEYPCTPEEAFLASGKNYFNTEIISKRKDYLVNLYKDHKIKNGYFTYKYATSPWTGEKTIDDNSIQFIIDDEIGYIKIYQDNIGPTEPYVIGADTAGDGSDFNVGQVIDSNQMQVATIRLQKDEDLFADQLYCLGKMYNEALISVEVNFSTYVNSTLVNREYPNIYIRETPQDAISMQITKKIGFNTNKATRPALLAELKTLLRDRPECFNDMDTLDEMFTFIVDSKSKPVAIVGKHDDTIMALGIALYSQEQQLNELKVAADKLEGDYTDTELEDLGYSAYEIRQYKQGQPLFIR